jgi:hypothetical protein
MVNAQAIGIPGKISKGSSLDELFKGRQIAILHTS